MLLQSQLDLLDYLSRGGVVVLLFVILYGGYKGWWVYGPSCKDIMKEKDSRNDALRIERDAWRDAALKSAGVAFALTEKRSDGAA